MSVYFTTAKYRVFDGELDVNVIHMRSHALLELYSYLAGQQCSGIGYNVAIQLTNFGCVFCY